MISGAESAEVVESLLDSLEMGLVLCGRELEVLAWSPCMARLTGVDAPEAVGRNARELLPELVGGQLGALFCRAQAGERGTSDDLPYEDRRSGAAGWIVAHVLPRRAGDGEVSGVVALFEDTTVRKRAEQASQATERDLVLHNRIAEVFLTAPEDEMYATVLGILLDELDSRHGIFGFIDGDGSLVVPSWSEEVFEACRVASPTAVFPPESWAGLWGEALCCGQGVVSNSPGRVPKGHIPIERSMFAPIVHGGGTIGLLGVANRDRDYTREDLERLEHIASHVAPILDARLNRDAAAARSTASERALRSSEARYRAIVEHQSELVTRFNADGVFTFVNQALCRSVDLPTDELLGRSIFELLPPTTAEATRRALASLTPSRPLGENEIEWRDPEGETRWIRWINHGFFGDDGELREVQAVGRDVTESRRREQELRWALAEKELLLKEVHHRVKNNLAVISSLLRLHAGSLGNREVAEAFETVQNRIRAMAVVHEQLYRSADFQSVSLVQYLEEVLRLLARSHLEAGERVSVHSALEEARVEIGEAIPCGLIVTELVSNAFRHAFPGSRGGRVEVALSRRRDGRHELAVRDDGVGMPAPDGEREGGRGFGIEMVRLLAEQLDGTVEIGEGPGTEVRVVVSPSCG